MAKIFWDTNLFVYLLESNPVFAGQVLALRNRMLARGDVLLTSALTVGEILVKPLEQGDLKLADQYRSLFCEPEIRVIAFDLAAASRYAAIRQDRGIRAPDAIQLACAAAAGADLFITNDDRLSRKDVAGISFITSLSRTPL